MLPQLRVSLVLCLSLLAVLVQAAGHGNIPSPALSSSSTIATPRFDTIRRQAGNQLIHFSKLKLENLVAIDMLMADKHLQYRRAHVMYTGRFKLREAIGHFYDWMEQMHHLKRADRQRTGYLSKFKTYGGQGNLTDDERWYDTAYLGTPQEPDLNDLSQLHVTPGATYDIHQATHVPLDDHTLLFSHIIKNGGNIGTVYLQWNHEQSVTQEGLKKSWYHWRVSDIYNDHASRMILLHPSLLDQRGTSITPDLLKGKVPREHIEAAQRDGYVDAAATKALIRANKAFHGGVTRPPLDFLPRLLWDHVRPDAYGSIQAPVYALIKNALRGRDSAMANCIAAWIILAKNKVREAAADTYLLDEIMQRLRGEHVDEVPFADAMFTVVLLKPSVYRAEFLQQRMEEAFTSTPAEAAAGSSSGITSDRVGSSQHPEHNYRILTYRRLPRDELLKKALAHFPSDFGRMKQKVRAWFHKLKLTGTS